MVREAALKTKGSGGPSGVDSNGFRRMMACKSFKKSGTNHCSAIATMTKKPCTEYVDPRSIEAILANRLIPLDKGEGKVRPIGVGEVIRRIMGKCVMSDCIDRLHKWPPKTYSFVYVLIRLTSLVCMDKIQ